MLGVGLRVRMWVNAVKDAAEIDEDKIPSTVVSYRSTTSLVDLCWHAPRSPLQVALQWDLRAPVDRRSLTQALCSPYFEVIVYLSGKRGRDC